jgi:Flp pilus assembly pilin Flp
MFYRFNAWVGSLYVRSHDLKKDDGQTMVEYALVLTLVAIAAGMLAAWSGLVTGVGNAVTDITSHL